MQKLLYHVRRGYTMQQVTVGSKYQVVIPKKVRQRIKGLIPGVQVIVGAVDDKTIAIKKVEKSWVEETRGIAKKAWKGIDTTKYLRNLRNEWANKSK